MICREVFKHKPASNDYSIEEIKTKSDRNGRFCLMPDLLL